MKNFQIKNYFIFLSLVLSICSCGKGKPVDPPAPLKPDPPKPVEEPIVLSNLRDIINPNDYISDSIWKDDSTRHTITVKIGPAVFTYPSSKEKVFPGAIISTNNISSLEKQDIRFEKLPVSIVSGEWIESYIPSFEHFTSGLNAYFTKNPKQFQSGNFDAGRPFSTYNDLVLLNGYKDVPTTNWLKINNKKSKLRKTGIVFTFKIEDLNVGTSLPRAGELIDKNKYKSEIEADSLGYVSNITIGKRAFLTFMCDTTYDAASAIIAKLKKKDPLSKEEEKVLKDGEIGYFLQGYHDKTISSNNNAEIVHELYEIIRNTITPGEPMSFSVRKIKDYAPYQDILKITIIRK